jgi:diguanylate cyclase (GGDEF)-like protein
MQSRLLTDLGLSGDEMRHRLARLSGAVAAGHESTLRERTLDEQEAIRRAALEIRERAEIQIRAGEVRFRHAALHDPLTGLPNRTLFTARLEQLFAGHAADARAGVCFIGLDGFKAVNDSRGHHVGDQLLIMAAERLSTLTTDSRHLVARLGGDEFAVLIENSASPDDGVKVADRVLMLLETPFFIDGHELPITASIGIVERSLSGTDPTEIMRAADITLHWAKDDGKGQWALFDADRNAHEVSRYMLSADMPAALARGEFTVAYQPMVDLSDGVLRGVEALARWHHPTHGVLTADRFIDLAESSGLIMRLGIHMLEQACRQAAGWQDLSPYPPFVSVNLAVRQLRNPGFPGQVAAILDRTNLAPDRLQLEITESGLMSAATGTAGTLRAVADLGVRLAIDDFGTGYSNLAYLGSLPVHDLKLAATFVQRLRTSRSTDAEAIIAALVSLGHTLGLTVTAEGIEGSAEASTLADIGCDTGQGWHFGRPAPARDITDLVATGRS